jgi:hypothetical protein
MGLPAPHGGLAGAGTVHDLGGAAAISGQQHDVRVPNVLLRAVAIRHDRRKSLAVVGYDVDGDPGAHATDSHAARRRGILIHGPSNSYCDIGGVKYQLEELV